MVFALFACAAAFQGSLTTPVPEPGKKPPVKKVAPAKKAPPKKKPPEKKPPERKPAEKKPADKKEPVEKKPADRKPVEKKPVEKKPTQPVAKPVVPKPAVKEEPPKFTDVEAGAGTPVRPGDTVVCHFHIQRRNGDEIADSKKRGLPYVVKIGAAGNDPLLDLVLKGMKPGGVRTCMVAAKTAYGPAGAPPIILPNDVLRVEVTLLRRGDK